MQRFSSLELCWDEEKAETSKLVRSLSIDDMENVTIQDLMEDIIPAKVVEELCEKIVNNNLTSNNAIIWEKKGAVELYYNEYSNEYGVWLKNNNCFTQFQFMIDSSTGNITVFQAIFTLRKRYCSQNMTVQDGKWINMETSNLI